MKKNKFYYFVLLLLFGLFSNNVFSQKYYTTLNLDTVPAPGTYIATESINLLPGFHFKATEGNSFDAKIGIKAQNPCLIASLDNFVDTVYGPCCGLSSPCELIRVCQNDTFEIEIDTIGYPTLSFYDLTRKFQYSFTNGTNSFSYPSTPQPCNTITLFAKLAIANAGIYYVELKIRDSIGNLVNQIGDSNKIYIEVISNHPNPIVLNVPADTCVGSNLVLTPMINITDPYIHYSFGWDGLETSYFGIYPHIRYQTNCPCPGTYNLWAVVDSGCGRSDTSFYTLKVSTMPDIQYIRNGCMQVDFTGNTCINSNNYSNFNNCIWLWNFGDGDTSNIQNPAHSYADTGMFNVSFSINYYDPSIGCNVTETATKTVHVNPIPLPIITGNHNNCDIFTSYTITNYDTNYYYHWSIIPITAGQVSSTSNLNTVNITWDTIINDTVPTIIRVIIERGNECKDTVNFNVYNCCGQGIGDSILHDDTIISALQIALLPSNFFINGTVVFDTNIELIHRTILMGPNAKIVVAQGYNLVIDNSYLGLGKICKFMWDGIYITGSNDTLNIKGNSIISDAINGLVSTNDGIINTDNANLSENYYNIQINNSTAPTYQGYFKYTQFTGAIHLAHPPLFNYKTYSGVECRNVKNITIGNDSLANYKNIFKNMQYGIHALNSNINVYNNDFINIFIPELLPPPPIIFPNGGFNTLPITVPSYPQGAVYAISTMSLRQPHILNVGGYKFKENTFTNCNTGIFSNNYINNIINNYIIDNYNGISLVNIDSTFNIFGRNVRPSIIKENVITVSSAPTFAPTKGISVQNTYHYPVDLLVDANSIYNYHTGIYAMNLYSDTMRKALIQYNGITFNLQNPTSKHIGIDVHNCNKMLLL